MSLSVFTVRSSYVEGRGWAQAEVIAPSISEALAAATPLDYIFEFASEVTVTRNRDAVCEHDSAQGNGNRYSPENPLTMWSCENCKATWGVDAEYPTPSASDYAFRVYCKNLSETGQFPYQD